MKDKLPADPRVQPIPKKPYKAWGLFNWGIPWGTYPRRKGAIAEAENLTGMPWSKARRYCMAVKVEVRPL